MSTAIQSAILEGFTALKSEHGQTWTRTVDSKTFIGVAGSIFPTSVQLVAGQDRKTVIVLLPSDEPTPALRNGNELTKGGRNYSVVRRDLDPESGLITVEVSVV